MIIICILFIIFIVFILLLFKNKDNDNMLNIKNDICIYTVVTGNYDSNILYNPKKKFNLDGYYISNNINLLKEAEKNDWNPIFIKSNEDNNFLSRRLKILMNYNDELSFLNKYNIVIYHDGNQKPIVNNFTKYINLMKNTDMIIFKHPVRSNLKSEIDILYNYRKKNKLVCSYNNLDLIKKKYDYFIKNNDNIGLSENRVIFRKTNSKNLEHTMKEWYRNLIESNCYRDQLHFQPILHKFKTNYMQLDYKEFPYKKFQFYQYNL
jgi:hypothetical protein